MSVYFPFIADRAIHRFIQASFPSDPPIANFWYQAVESLGNTLQSEFENRLIIFDARGIQEGYGIGKLQSHLEITIEQIQAGKSNLNAFHDQLSIFGVLHEEKGRILSTLLSKNEQQKAKVYLDIYQRSIAIRRAIVEQQDLIKGLLDSQGQPLIEKTFRLLSFYPIFADSLYKSLGFSNLKDFPPRVKGEGNLSALPTDKEQIFLNQFEQWKQKQESKNEPTSWYWHVPFLCLGTVGIAGIFVYDFQENIRLLLQKNQNYAWGLAAYSIFPFHSEQGNQAYDAYAQSEKQIKRTLISPVVDGVFLGLAPLATGTRLLLEEGSSFVRALFRMKPKIPPVIEIFEKRIAGFIGAFTLAFAAYEEAKVDERKTSLEIGLEVAIAATLGRWLGRANLTLHHHLWRK